MRVGGQKLDLPFLASVRVCANALLERGGRFDAVIANAGVMAIPQERTVGAGAVGNVGQGQLIIRSRAPACAATWRVRPMIFLPTP